MADYCIIAFYYQTVLNTGVNKDFLAELNERCMAPKLHTYLCTAWLEHFQDYYHG